MDQMGPNLTWVDLKGQSTLFGGSDLDFKPKNSEFKNVKVNVSAVNLGLGFNF